MGQFVGWLLFRLKLAKTTKSHGIKSVKARSRSLGQCCARGCDLGRKRMQEAEDQAQIAITRTF